ncbi:9621_t:CDS:2, partial [Gigaspora rosea]
KQDVISENTKKISIVPNIGRKRNITTIDQYYDKSILHNERTIDAWILSMK